MTERVLVVDDEPNIVSLVESALELAGYQTAHAATGRDAVDRADTFSPHLIVLDVMLPDIDGFTVLRRLQDRLAPVPVIFLTARRAPGDRVHGLTVGGDDYLVKPFAVAELVTRVGLSLRRHARPEDTRGSLAYADLAIEDGAHRATRAGRKLSLSPTEYRLLRFLVLSAGRAVTRAEILDAVWDDDPQPGSAVVDTFISNLRRKVDSTEPKLIHTVRSFGFCLRVD